MRIVNRQTFLALPAGTLYMTYEPCVFGPPLIKGETIHSSDDGRAIDHWVQALNTLVSAGSFEDFDILERAEQKGDSFPLDLSCESRECLYDVTQLYAVYERADVEQLISRLQEALAAGYRT